MGNHNEFLKIFGGLVILLLVLSGSIYYLENFQKFSKTSTEVVNQKPTLVPGEKKQPDAYAPSSGVCLEPLSGEVVTVKINNDTSSIRCLKVLNTQKLQVENETTKTADVQLGPFEAKLAPGQKQLFDLSFETYLEPGIHFVSATPYSGVELWFQR